MISFELLRRGKVFKSCHVETNLSREALRRKLKKVLKDIDDRTLSLRDVLLCSVVPHITKIIKPVIKKHLGLEPLVVGQDIIVPIKNRYKNPRQVGQDRLVCAYAAKQLYGYPVIVIDFGTAITFELVSAAGDYEGGIIVPGIQLSADSLFQRTALLPRIDKIKRPRQLIGKTTKESILSGIFHGYGAMCRGLIDSIAKDLKRRPRIVMTGGYTDIMKKYLTRKDCVIVHDLVFQGMLLVYKQSRN